MKLKTKYRLHSSDQRLYQIRVPIIGLTGGIASGKSTVSRMLEARGFAVINADHLVKDVYDTQEALEFITKKHADVIQDGKIVFPLLREKFFKDKKVKLEIENFIYQRLPDAFLAAYRKLNSPQVVIYDVPLLFEKNMEAMFDVTVLVYASRKIQQARLMTRDGHEEAMAKTILDQQLDIEDKKLKAEFVIDNSRTEAELAEGINEFLHQYFENYLA
jgi:dephospho-CoA kinase